MTYQPPPPPPASFLPPAPPRPSRAGGLVLLLAGLLGSASVWLPWFAAMGQSLNLQQFADTLGDFTPDGLDDPNVWLYSSIAGGAIAVLFGLIGLAGSKGANVTAGVFGLVAAVALAYPPVWMMTGAELDNMGEILDILSFGYYAATVSAVLALVGAITAFAGSGKR